MNDAIETRKRGVLPDPIPADGIVLLSLTYDDARAIAEATEVARKTCREGRAGRFVVRIRPSDEKGDDRG